MKIKRLNVEGLFGRDGQTTFSFNEDLNILTGRNGAGKTTILKLIWCILSGNIIYALQEINFKSCTLETDAYLCKIFRTSKDTCKVEMVVGTDEYLFEDENEGDDGSPFADAAEDKAGFFLTKFGSSIFFPTFRRIEGGFSLTAERLRPGRPTGRNRSEIDDALNTLSRKLSNDPHIFVASISTFDINNLLLKRYADISDEVNAYQRDISQKVIDEIRAYQSSASTDETADTVLSRTRSEIEKIESFRTERMLPLEAIRSLVEVLFKQHSSITFGTRLKFGDAADSINSDVLSAGEKQMLSFICYNAFYKDAIFIVDEPELSLHVDWQRKLFSVLNSQNTTNQFIFATHSPFIYGRYPDKEISIVDDRGDSLESVV